ncbi:MAG TPA: excinuclease ABC subunit UvrA [Bacteroidota bacterium]|nr:excinuclease ABC subunit UvrA [Bacteroidota bacterium]
MTIRGARVHNLKNISLELPRNALIVITGVSGSGKSSLAFDTIYAEGQRRYVESLSSYARQFLERMDKPDVDLIQGISPAMAIEQKTNTRNPRSTVGTSTEIYDYLRLLYARIGRTFCARCGKPVERDSVQTVAAALTRKMQETGERELRIHVTFPLPLHPKESVEQALTNLKKEGFFRVVVGGEVIDLNEQPVPARTKARECDVLVDRVVYRGDEADNRIADSIETAFASGNGKASVLFPGTSERLNFNRNFACSDCHIPYEEPDPRLFSFNNPFGACPECQGFGRAIGIDMDLVIPNRSRTIREGAIQPWSTPKFKEYLRALLRAAPKSGLRVDVPFSALSEDEVRMVREGTDGFDGIDAFFRLVEKKAYKIYYRVLLSRYRAYTTCPACDGARLRPEALNIRVCGKRLPDIVRMTVAAARQFVATLDLTPYEAGVARRILEELNKRLAYLDDVGIGYLTLDRLSSTLSGGESQRINLATSLGSSLVGAVYVLDEPSIGLHPRDNGKLIGILQRLRAVGNTVIVVEHDMDMMRASDRIVDMGPGAGEGGGEVVFNGTLAEILQDPASLTGAYLAGRKRIPVPATRRPADGYALRILGASEHNLKNVDVTIPLHALVCVTGVSGSGKSTLIHDVLHSGLLRAMGQGGAKAGRHRSIEGVEHLSAVEMVDQSPIGRTPRSNPVTYIHVFDLIRTVFASTAAARVHGLKPGAFSFNVPGGRCDACEGDGVVKVEMQFLADLYLICDVCKGKRYKKDILDIRYRGKNIDDVLGMTVDEACAFFAQDATGRKIAERLKILQDVGLGYIRLGQPATSLSGGEAQRIKLAGHLASPPADRHTLFLFDEPTTGLHVDDIARLLQCFNALINAGNSVVIIEHNMDVIKCADWIIDLGPEAGEEGGGVVAAGTPEEVAEVAASHTGRCLASLLGTRERKERGSRDRRQGG